MRAGPLTSLACGVGLLVALTACGGDDGGPSSGTPVGMSSTSSTSSSGGTDTAADTGTTTGDDSSTTTEGVTATAGTDTAGDTTTSGDVCEGVNCGTFGNCEDQGGVPVCQCDTGYIVPDGAAECVEDRDCIETRVLDCRTDLTNGSAVGVHVAINYCSGNPVLGLTSTDLTVEEDQGEGFEAVLPAESKITVIDRDFTTHLYVAVDVSQSIKDSGRLAAVAQGIDEMLAQLDAAGTSMRVSLYAFDGKPYLYPVQAETGDIVAARAAAANIPTTNGNDAGSTNLYANTINVLREVDRDRELRESPYEEGSLTTGVVVLVSDGDDEAGTSTLTAVTTEFQRTPTNVITVGLGDAADFPRLSELGRDGSFAAQDNASVVQAFRDIATRVSTFNESVYLVGYCSPKRGGLTSTRVLPPGATDGETCDFSAALFQGGCTEDAFNPAVVCAANACGGSVAGCGTCGAGQCCFQGACVAPTDATVCPGNEDWVCGDSATCEPDNMGGLECQACGMGGCPTAGAAGDACANRGECTSKVCGADPDNPGAVSDSCLEGPVKMFQPCSTTQVNGECEEGSYCDALLTRNCQPLKADGAVCSQDYECRSQVCNTLAQGERVCAQASACIAEGLPY